MKFYIARNEGKRLLFARQDHAKAMDPKFERIDIETSFDGLKTFIEGLYAQIDGASIAAVTVPEVAPEPVAKEVVIKASSAVTQQEVMEWLLDHATQPQIENIFQAIGCRFGELHRANHTAPPTADLATA